MCGLNSCVGKVLKVKQMKKKNLRIEQKINIDIVKKSIFHMFSSHSGQCTLEH